MPGLVEQIQREASDNSVSVTQLLRHVKMASSKLNLPAVEEWVEHELRGYPDEHKVPRYRVLGCTPMAHSVYQGWRLMALGSEEQVNKLFQLILFDKPVAEVESVANSKPPILITYPEFLERMTVPHMSGVDRIAAQVDTSKFFSILDGVRDRALDWALELENAGVTGEGMSFTLREREAAQSVTNIFIGDNARQNNHSTDNSTNTVVRGNLFGDLKARINSGVADEVERQQLVVAVEEMETSRGTGRFAAAYGKFISLAANHMQLVQPFLGGLTGMLAGG